MPSKKTYKHNTLIERFLMDALAGDMSESPDASSQRRLNTRKHIINDILHRNAFE